MSTDVHGSGVEKKRFPRDPSGGGGKACYRRSLQEEMHAERVSTGPRGGYKRRPAGLHTRPLDEMDDVRRNLLALLILFLIFLFPSIFFLLFYAYLIQHKSISL